MSPVCLCEISFLRVYDGNTVALMSWQQQEGGLLLLSEQMMATRFSAAVTQCNRYLDALKARLKKATHRQESTVAHPPRHHAFIIITERMKARFPERSDPDRFLPAGT